uniref:Uncharacterized protein n=1 Tax=Glossina brevipalpis TaxID=37001 RepID=A0A1A9W3S5_9MUSC
MHDLLTRTVQHHCLPYDCNSFQFSCGIVHIQNKATGGIREFVRIHILVAIAVGVLWCGVAGVNISTVAIVRLGEDGDGGGCVLCIIAYQALTYCALKRYALIYPCRLFDRRHPKLFIFDGLFSCLLET